jgi:hypothetical protein
VTVVLFVLLTIIVVVGCSSSDIDDHELPEGWTRVQFREGYVARDTLDGFTIDLPPGWSVGESWASSTGPSGSITGTIEDGRARAPSVIFTIGSPLRRSLEHLLDDGRIDVTQPNVDGQKAVLYLAKEFAIDDGPQVGIYYQHIPGAPEGVVAPSLMVDGDSRGFTDPGLLGKVLTSIRYRPLEQLPDLPEITWTPGEDWQREAARLDAPTFTLMLPASWNIAEQRGIDSLVGKFGGDGMTIFYDFGFLMGTPSGSESDPNSERYVPHQIWEESVGELSFELSRPLDPGASGSTGAFIQHTLPGEERRGVSIYGLALTPEQQEIALAIFRTIEFE